MTPFDRLRVRADGRMAERLSPSAYRTFIANLPRSLRQAVLEAGVHRIPLADTSEWDMEWHSWGTVIRRQNLERTHLCIVFCGFAHRFYLPPVSLVTVFPRKKFDFAFVFDTTRTLNRVDEHGRDKRTGLFEALLRYAEPYRVVLSVGHSAGGVSTLELQQLDQNIHALAISPATIRAERILPFRSYRYKSLYYDRYCDCSAKLSTGAPRSLVVASRNSAMDRDVATRLSQLSGATQLLVDGPTGHGLWRKPHTSVREFHGDLDRFLKLIGL